MLSLIKCYFDLAYPWTVVSIFSIDFWALKKDSFYSRASYRAGNVLKSREKSCWSDRDFVGEVSEDVSYSDRRSFMF